MNTLTERTLHLIDIENLTGSPSPSPEEVREFRRQYETSFVGDGDLVVVACSHHAFPSVGWEWSTARHIVRSGVDGADLALLDVIELECVDKRFGSVVIGSGDGIFANAAAQLGSAGVHVTVVSRPERLSRRLRLAARSLSSVPSLHGYELLPLESA